MTPHFQPPQLIAASAGLPLAEGQVLHLRDCAQCQQALAAEQAARAQYLSRAPAHEFTRLVVQKVQARRRRLLGGGLAAGVALAASLVLLLAPTLSHQAVHLKGSAVFRVFLKRGERIEQASATTRFKPTDHLRFVYHAEQPGFVLVLDVDAAGHLQPFVPFAATQAVPVVVGDNELPGSVALDAAEGPEHLVAVWCPKAFDLAAVTSRTSARGRLPPVVAQQPACTADIVTLEKEP